MNAIEIVRTLIIMCLLWIVINVVWVLIAQECFFFVNLGINVLQNTQISLLAYK